MCGAHCRKQDYTPCVLVTELQGNYSTILGRDWIHANHYVPSTLHQFLIQWIGDDVKVVHADNSAQVDIAKASSWPYYDIKCLSGQNLSDCDFLSVSKDSFVPVFVKPMENRLNHIM